MRIDQLEDDPSVMMGMMTAIQEFATELGPLIEDRRESPRDDLVSIWASAELGGCPMELSVLVQETGLFISGGAETTRTVIARGLYELARHPEAWDAMASDPEVVPNAVEEIIRWVTPLNNMFRTATRDARDRRHSRPRRRPGGAALPVGQPRRSGLRRSVHLRHLPPTRTRRWRSGPGRTSASGRRSPGSSSARSSRTSPGGSRTCGWSPSPTSSRTSSWARCARSGSASTAADRHGPTAVGSASAGGARRCSTSSRSRRPTSRSRRLRRAAVTKPA